MDRGKKTHAVVIGAGIAGLSAAAALAGHVETVTVLERDERLFRPNPRPGVPQGRQPHLLMSGGLIALKRLFPGLEDDLIMAGAIPCAPGRDLRTEFPGLGMLPKRDFDIATHALTRPALEAVIIASLQRRGNVVVRPGMRARNIRTSSDGTRTTAVEFTGKDRFLRSAPADIVVDASSSGRLTLACLEQNGRQLPQETVIDVDIGYSSAVFTMPKSASFDFVAMVTQAAPPEVTRNGYMFQISEDRWQILLVGRGKDQPPAELDRFFEFAQGFGTQTIADALRLAVYSEPPARFRFPASIRRHFNRPTHPAGLIPIGDALCRFNPIYGQGMTVAAQEAALLHELFNEKGSDAGSLATLTRTYLARCEPLVERAWTFSTTPDFAFTETSGTPPPDIEVRLQRQVEFAREAITNPEAHFAMLEAIHLLGPVDPAPSPHMPSVQQPVAFFSGAGERNSWV